MLSALLMKRPKGSRHVYADRDELSKLTGMHQANISSATSSLQKDGIMRVKRNRRGCNDYYFLCPLPDCRDEQDLDIAEPATPGGSGMRYIKKSRCSAIRSQDVAESATPLQTNTDQEEEKSAFPYTFPEAGDRTPELPSPVKRQDRFKRPTTQEVADFLRAEGLDRDCDAEMFVDFYESKGWKVGSSPMENWRAAVRTWVRRSRWKSALKRTLESSYF